MARKSMARGCTGTVGDGDDGGGVAARGVDESHDVRKMSEIYDMLAAATDDNTHAV